MADLVAAAAALIVNSLVRRRWWNLGLLGLVAGLAAVVAFEARQEQVALAPPLLDLPPAQIERIAVERAGQTRLRFERRDGRWWMVEPASGWVNPVLLTPILQLVDMRCPLHYAAAGLELKALHLDPPQVQLWLNDREIRFGTTAPADGQRYLQIGSTVWLCPDALYPVLVSAAGGFLAPTLDTLLPAAKGRE